MPTKLAKEFWAYKKSLPWNVLGHPELQTPTYLSYVLELLYKLTHGFAHGFQGSFLLLITSFIEDKKKKQNLPHGGGKKYISAMALPDCTRSVYLAHLQDFALEETREDSLGKRNSGAAPGKFRIVWFTVMKKTMGLKQTPKSRTLQNELNANSPFSYYPSLSHNSGRTT